MSLETLEEKMPRKNRGLTLVEVVISAALFLLIWLALIGSLIIGKAAETRARHRIQATYAAQRYIEYLRKQPFVDIVSTSGIPITIDTRGTDSTTDDLVGTVTVTLVKSDMPGLDIYRKAFTVQIRWNERRPWGTLAPVTETIGTYIADDPQLN